MKNKVVILLCGFSAGGVAEYLYRVKFDIVPAIVFIVYISIAIYKCTEKDS